MSTIIEKGKKKAKQQKKVIKKHTDRFIQHVDKKLRRRVIIYFAIALVMLLIASYERWISQYSLLGIAMFFVLGVVLGFIFARMFHLKRDTDQQNITSRIDRIGVVLLVLYIGFAIARRYIVHEFTTTHSAYLAVYLALLSGLMLGRFFGLQKKIFSLLKTNLVKKS